MILWGTGFGATTPAAPDGQVLPAAAYPLMGVTVTVGGTPVSVLAPGLAAVYQIAIQVPAGMANGDYPVVAAVNGISSPSAVKLTVQQ